MDFNVTVCLNLTTTKEEIEQVSLATELQEIHMNNFTQTTNDAKALDEEYAVGMVCFM